MRLASPAEFDALARADFWVFAQKVFVELNPGTTYLDNFHIQVICAELQGLLSAARKRIIVNVPPRSLKSLIVCVALPAYLLGHDPTRKIIAVSYGQDLADEFGRQTRQVMSASWYQRLFARCRLNPDRLAAHNFETTLGGGRQATSIGGVLTGFGADIIIIDDPMKPDQAASDAERIKANSWYSHTLVSRLNDKNTGSIIVLMQRLHQEDFVGSIQELEPWDVFSFPAIAQRDERWVVTTPFGTRVYERAEGQPLHPDRENLDALARLRATMGTELFSAQYLQSPMPPGGGMIKAAWFPRFPADYPPTFDRIVQSWDSANKVGELNDYSVCVTFGIAGKRVYILEVFRQRVEYPGLKRFVRELADRWNAGLVLVEDRASGTQLSQDLRADGFWKVSPVSPKGDKTMRMREQTAMIEGGGVLLPERAPWLDEFLAELMVFPRGKHDDQVDALSQALRWFSDQTAPTSGFLVIAQRFNEFREGKVPGAVKMRSTWHALPPLGVFEVGDFLYMVHPDEVQRYLDQKWVIVKD